MIEFNSKEYKRGNQDICTCQCHDPKLITHLMHQPGANCCEKCPTCQMNIATERLIEHSKEHSESK